MSFSRVLLRRLGTSSVQRSSVADKANIDKGYFELKKLQEHFQKNDGKPVFLKGSFMDQVLYRFTVALCLVGIGGMGKLFYELSFPKQ